MNEAPELTYERLLAEASEPVIPNLAPGPEYGADKRLFQGMPSIERAPNGRLWATWCSGGQGESPLNYVLLATSSGVDANWETPVLVVDTPKRIRVDDSTIWLDPDGRLWLFWTQIHTLQDGRWGVWAITTEEPDSSQPTWCEPRRLGDGVMLNKPTVTSGGDWLFPVSRLGSNVLDNEVRMLPHFLRTHVGKLISDEEKRAIDERSGAWVLATDDHGESFTERGRAKVPDEFATHNEQMIVERADGQLVMYIRTSYGIGQSVSSDGGATWSPVIESNIPNTSSRFHVRKLRSGRLLLVKNGPVKLKDENGEPNAFNRTRLTAFLSEDDGDSWTGGLLLDERGVTYPDATEDSDGVIRVIYDHGRRHEKMILMARFTEEDVLAKRLVSPVGRLKILIDQATGVISPDEDWSQFKGKDDPEGSLIFTGI